MWAEIDGSLACRDQEASNKMSSKKCKSSANSKSNKEDKERNGNSIYIPDASREMVSLLPLQSFTGQVADILAQCLCDDAVREVLVVASQ